MDETDLELRRRTYAFIVEHGRAPVAAELGTAEEVVAGWRRLHEEHALVLNGATDELRMLNPFAAAPTAYRVQVRGRAGGTATSGWATSRSSSTASSRRTAGMTSASPEAG